MKKVLVFVMGIFLAGMSILCLFYPKQEISYSERRKLNQFPKLSVETIISGKFMDEFEEYAADQFPFRDVWRSFKSDMVFELFGQSDYNELYVMDEHVTKMEYPLNEDSVSRATKVFQNIYDKQLVKNNCRVYYSIIPDKNYFLGKNHLCMDYEKLVSIIQKDLGEMEYIDIMEFLEADDYYKTDTHWRQEKIVDVAEKLAKEMGTTISAQYETKRLETPFYGVYYGQLALPSEPDELCYLTNETLESCVVYDFQNERETTIYDMEKGNGEDPYEMFLSGSISLLEIRNPKADMEHELVIFRDSFGSAVAPLLIQGYSKITLVDIRYIASSQVETYVDFEGADVLFLYSTSVLNHSQTLR